jgi:hypothetical protein
LIERLRFAHVQRRAAVDFLILDVADRGDRGHRLVRDQRVLDLGGAQLVISAALI